MLYSGRKSAWNNDEIFHLRFMQAIKWYITETRKICFEY